ncbi:MAG: hypothetical protein AB1649_28350, partial [Chloroflexota bacterium]
HNMENFVHEMTKGKGQEIFNDNPLRALNAPQPFWNQGQNPFSNLCKGTGGKWRCAGLAVAIITGAIVAGCDHYDFDCSGFITGSKQESTTTATATATATSTATSTVTPTVTATSTATPTPTPTIPTRQQLISPPRQTLLRPY